MSWGDTCSVTGRVSVPAPWPLGLKRKSNFGFLNLTLMLYVQIRGALSQYVLAFLPPFSLLELIGSWWGRSAPQTLFSFFPLCFSDRITVHLPANSLKAAPAPLQWVFLFAVKFFNSRLFHVVFQKILLYWYFYSSSHFHNIFLKFFKHGFL